MIYEALAKAVLSWYMPKVPNSYQMQQQFNQMVQSGASLSQLINGLEEMAKQNGMISAFDNVPSWRELKNKNPEDVQSFVENTISEMGVKDKIINSWLGG